MNELLTSKKEWENNRNSKRYSKDFYERNLRINNVEEERLIVNLFINEMIENGFRESKKGIKKIEKIEEMMKEEKNGLVVFTPELSWGSYIYGLKKTGKLRKYISLGGYDKINNKINKYFGEDGLSVEIYNMTEDEFFRDKEIMEKYEGVVDIVICEVGWKNGRIKRMMKESGKIIRIR